MKAYINSILFVSLVLISLNSSFGQASSPNSDYRYGNQNSVKPDAVVVNDNNSRRDSDDRYDKIRRTNEDRYTNNDSRNYNDRYTRSNKYNNDRSTKVNPDDNFSNYNRDNEETITRNNRDDNGSITRNNRYEDDSRNNDTENYFKVDKSRSSLWNGKYWKSSDFPLKVYVKTIRSKHFKELYNSYIDYAFAVWKKADNRINFKYVSDESDADITFEFENNLMEKYDENYLGLTDYELGKNNMIVKSTIEISLLKHNSKKLSDGEIKATIVHELGHAIGLGHSDNENDIMYPYINPDTDPAKNYKDLSSGDISSVRSLMDFSKRYQYSTR